MEKRKCRCGTCNRRAVMEDLTYKMNVLNEQLGGNAEENVLGNMLKSLLGY